MAPPDQSRRGFLHTSALAGVGAATGATGSAPAAEPAAAITACDASLSVDSGATRPRPAGQQPVHDLTTTPLERVRIACIGTGERGASLMHEVLGVEFADIVAVCDLHRERAERVADAAATARGARPRVFGGSERAWEQVCDLDGVDVVYVASPWEWHAPMALRAMERGKHAFVEVAATPRVEDCWELVDASERTRRHCVMLENCCYGENELFVLNMARAGVFGDLTHAECAYIHDLRRLLFDLGSEGAWRRSFHCRYDGNLYPTHGLGPVCQYLGVGRGDQFQFLVSMSSPERGLTAWRGNHHPDGGKLDGERYRCGDMNTSLIKTARGRTIMLQHDIVSPRPYSRINALSGTGATFFDYPARLAVDDPKQYGLEATGPHAWLSDADVMKMRERFTHPLWKKLAERAQGSGHGGMDFVENYRHLDCIRQGITPDIVVYDGAAWSCLIEITARSVETGSMPVAIPDFTRGLWKSMRPLAIVS